MPAAVIATRITPAVVALAMAFAVPAPVGAQAPTEPGLDQTIERDQAVAAGPAFLDDGHVDIGPTLVDDTFSLLVHDDSEVPSVWRELDDTVIVVGDDALQTVPDDPTYAFLGVEPGTAVHVVPQVQQPGVVWVGWNTQDPRIMERIDRGVTLTLLGVQGPGELTMYLQSGNLDDPEVLWQSTTAARQPVWVEVNSHTHANWVFTEPGAYLVQVEVAADLVGGVTVSDVQTLRFAVGDSIRPEDLLAATYTQPSPPTAEAPAGTVTGGSEGSSSSSSPLPVGVVVGGVALAGAAAVVAARGAGARRQAERQRTADNAGRSS